MLNRYPLWKNLMVALVIAIGFSIRPQSLWRRSGLAGLCQPWCRSANQKPLDQVKKKSKPIPSNRRVGARLHPDPFNNTEDQLKGQDIVANKYWATISSPPSTWLRPPRLVEAIGAAP